MTKNFRIELYNCTVQLVVEDDIHLLKKKYKAIIKKHKLGEDHSEECFEGMVLNGKYNSEFFMLLSKDKINANLISHECAHLCIRVFKYNNISVEDEEESFALLTGWMNEKITHLTNDILKRKTQQIVKAPLALLEANKDVCLRDVQRDSQIQD